MAYPQNVVNSMTPFVLTTNRASSMVPVMKRIIQPSESVAGELIGYARVSTPDQRLDLQLDALKKVKCLVIYQEKIGATKHRPELDRLIRDLRPGDTLVVWRLDRMARSVRDFSNRLVDIEAAGAKFRSLTEHFDTVSAMGRLMMHVVASMAELERQLTVERTIAGMAEARKRGVQIGQKLIVDDTMKAKIAKMWTAKTRSGEWKYTTREVAKHFGISTSSINNRMPGGREAYVVKRRN